jgi:hypothetical protein
MGSTGTGRLSDYSGSEDLTKQTGGSSGEDSCNKAISANLEDVERCAYFKVHDDVPTRETQVSLVLNKRLMVIEQSGLIIGYIPTQFNYLAGCINRGLSYRGIVSASSRRPIARVLVDLAPTSD